MWRRFLTPIGAGTFGEVWHAEYFVTPIQAAVKVSFRCNKEEALKEELGVLEKLAGLKHPAIIGVRNVSRVEGRLLVGMELAEQSLLARLQECRRRTEPFPIPELLVYIREIAEGLDYLRSCKMLHGGVNPTDVLLFAGHAKIADFGPLPIPAHMERLGMAVPFYKAVCMAPELKLGEPTEHSDQFALASTYAWMRLGHPPFSVPRGASEMELLPKQEQDVLVTAMSREPTQRFPSCCKFAEALENAE